MREEQGSDGGLGYEAETSVYPATVRHQVIVTALDRWHILSEEEDRGVCPVHCTRKWREQERWRKKEVKNQNWHKGEKGQVFALLLLIQPEGTC